MSSGDQAGINWVQVIAAALAAMSSAVLLSTLGVAGTIVGAAVGSLIASVGGAFYTRGIAASHQQVAAQAAALRRATQARDRGEGPQGTAVLDPVLDPMPDSVPDEAREADAPTTSDTTEPDELRNGDENRGEHGDEHGDPLFHAEPGKPLPWKRIAIVAGALFLVVMVAITCFELLSGKPVSSLTGGSDKDSGTTLFEDSPKDTPSPSPTQPDTTQDSSPTEDSGSASPTDEASPTDTPTGLSSVTPSPTGTDTASPTESAATDAG